MHALKTPMKISQSRDMHPGKLFCGLVEATVDVNINRKFQNNSAFTDRN